MGWHTTEWKAWLPGQLRGCCTTTKLQVSCSRSQGRDLEGLSKAGRWEQDAADGRKLLFKKRIKGAGPLRQEGCEHKLLWVGIRGLLSAEGAMELSLVEHVDYVHTSLPQTSCTSPNNKGLGFL